MRSDSTKIIIAKYFKTKKSEHSYEKAKYYFGRIRISKIDIFSKNITLFKNKNITFRDIFESPPGTRAIAKDPGNERFRMRSDSTQKITKNIEKQKS